MGKSSEEFLETSEERLNEIQLLKNKIEGLKKIIAAKEVTFQKCEELIESLKIEIKYLKS